MSGSAAWSAVPRNFRTRANDDVVAVVTVTVPWTDVAGPTGIAPGW